MAMIRRRDFLKAGAALPLVGLPGRASSGRETSCILLMLVGGPSHLDTWDMKPDAPSNVRGPFRPIKTNVPGIEISEIFPRMARHADKYALIRSVHHEAAAVHDTGYQLMQTGRLAHEDGEYPHIGCVMAKETGTRHVVLPHRIGNTGVNLTNGQSAGFLGADYEPQFMASPFDLTSEPEHLRAAYGLNPFGESCLMARRLVESGTRFVTVNMFDTVFDRVTWDSHGSKPFSSIADYRDHVGPMFDNAYSSLLEDLDRRGMLESTLVVGTGEFGRSPKINPAGGRDHWPQCWTIHVAGGGIKGGQVYGSSDKIGAEPKDNPVDPATVVATIHHALGVPPVHNLAEPLTRLFV
ncbi:MAG TPA: DUF1501 domain-containing protein [Bryobacteraceae bacterium]|nr:DUF1501 domain-containing protein [Bryobacteraceae bacterium]